jgi:hypothetical protein
MDPSQLRLLQQMFSYSTLQEPEEPSDDRMLSMLHKAKATAEKEKNQPPVPLAYAPPMMMITQMTMGRQGADQREREKPKGDSNLHTTYVGQKIQYSERPLKELKPSKKIRCRNKIHLTSR